MKKFLSMLVAVMMIFVIVSCGQTGGTSGNSGSSANGNSDISESVTKVSKTFSMGVVNGAPALAVANIAGGFDFSDEKNDVKTNVNVEKDAPAVIAGLTNGTYDMAILPLNVASKLYNAGKLGVKLVSVNIFSVLHVLTKGEYNNLNDMKGKVVYTVGAGGTPEVALKNILTANGIKFADGDKGADSETVYINAVSEAQLVMVALKKGEADFAILGEPVVSQAMAKTGAKIAFSVEDEWKKAHPGVGFVQAGLIVKSALLDNYGGYIDALMEKMGENNAYVNEHVETVSDELKLINATLPKLSAETLARSLIGADKASVRRADIEAFLKALNPADYGGKLPSGDFYAR